MRSYLLRIAFKFMPYFKRNAQFTEGVMTGLEGRAEGVNFRSVRKQGPLEVPLLRVEARG